MRKVATLKTPIVGVQRLMICADERGAYLFRFYCQEDAPCEADTWHESVKEAEAAALDGFAISPADWTVIHDPPNGAQHDRIATIYKR